MNKALHCTTYTVSSYQQPKLLRLAVVFCFIIISLLATNISHAQAIAETFEESMWTTASLKTTSSSISTGGGASVTNNNFGTTTVTIPASTSVCSITTYSANILTAGVATTMLGQSAAAVSTWAYSAASTTGTPGGYRQPVHSYQTGVVLAAGEGYLITPYITGGMAQVTFWMANASGAGSTIYVGLRTNTTAAPVWPTTNGSGSTATGGVTHLFSINSSTYTINNPNGTAMSQFTLAITGTNSTAPIEVAFASNTAGPFVYIDDIIMTSSTAPTITLGTMPSVCYSASSQSTTIPYSATTAGPTTYSISGWSDPGFSNVTNAALAAAPSTVPITVPAGQAPGTYTGTLTVSNGTITSGNYSISVTVNAGPGPGLYTIPAGSYAYYKMAGSAADSIGNDAGTLVNAPTSATDRFGVSNAAYTFNGTTQYISTSTDVDAHDPLTFTESIWFKTSTANGALMGFQNSTGTTPVNHDRVLYLSAGKVVYTIYNNGTAVLDSIKSTSTYNDNKWHMASVVNNGTSGFTLYVDGVSVANSGALSYTLQTYATTADLIIGYHYLNAGGLWLYPASYDYFTGTLDDAYLDNNTALTAAQIYALYTGINATSNSPICLGSTLNLAQQIVNTGSTTNTYSWTGPASFTSTSANPTRSNSVYADSGEYYITVTNPTTGCTLSDSVDVAYSQTYWAYSIPTGTQSYYNFSGNANDSIGTNTGTLQAAPTATTNRYGVASKAYTFNGSSQYVSTATSYTNPTNFSLSAWFKTTGSNGVLVGFGNTQTGAEGNYDRNLFMYNGRIFFGIFNGAVDTVSSPLSYNDGNWHLAAATESSTSGMKLYVDGALVASNASYTTPQNYSGYWRIGDNGSWVVDYFTGSLDDIAISNTTVFSAASIAEEYFGLNPTSNSPVCPGTALSLNEGYTATGGTYAWTGPSSYSNATKNPTIASPANSGEYYITVTTSGGCSTNDSLAVIAGSNYIWTGTTSSTWSTGSNWTCGSAPGATDNATVPYVGPTYPQPVLTTDATINNVVDSPSATIGLAGHMFTINGALSGTGTISGSSTSGLTFGSTASSATLYMTSTADTLGTFTLGDSTTTHHTITLGNALNIASTGTLTVGSTTGAALATGGFLTLVSDNSGSARVAAVPTSSGTSLSTINGTVNVQCYIHSTSSAVSTARRAWRLLTAPVTNNGLGTATTIYNSWQNGGTFTSGVGTMITAPSSVATGGSGNGMDYGINANYSMYTWTVGTQVLTKVNNTKTTNISSTNASAANAGYFIFIRGDRTPNTVNSPWLATINNTTLSATGKLQLGDQAFTSASGALSATSGKLSLVGNPYACSINFKKVAGDTATYTSGLSNIINRFYVWNSNLTGTQGVGGYVCIDDPSNTGTYTKSLGQSGTASYADLNIQSGQAFFVVTNTTAASSITFKENTKTVTNNFVYRPEQQEHAEAAGLPGDYVTGTLSLLNSDGSTSLSDGVVAQFNNDFCGCVDYIDAPKFTNVDEMFSLARDGKQLCIERRPEVVSTDTLFLNLKQMHQRDYQFGFLLHLLNHPGLGARLEDSYTSTKTALNINGMDTANFTINADAASSDTARFKIVFGAVNIEPAYTNINATRAGNTIVVKWSLSNDNNMRGYALQKSTDGVNYTMVYTTVAEHTSGAYSWIDTNPVIGVNYYRVLSTNVLNEESYSTVVSVSIVSLNPAGITVYPNPIQNGQIGLAMNNMAAGNYRYRLLNEIGQDIQTGNFTHSGGNATLYIPLTKSIQRGTYELEIFLPDNTKMVLSIVY
jgi:hypothetical protein